MSSFKFNFSTTPEVNESKGTEHTETAKDTMKNTQWFESLEIIPSNQLNDLDLIVNHAKMFICGDVEIGHVVIGEIMSQIQGNEVKNVLKMADNNHSDLVEGIYEGGLKIWECTTDVVSYFEENKDHINFENKRVLDLGCGAGILGIYALINKANVTFQDYNKEVIEHVTIPNVLLNIEEDERQAEIKKCKFYSGDWASFSDICQDSYDIIITSETIYNQSNYDKLVSLFSDRLRNDGTVYVAAKTHYFGVGGGTRIFEEIIKKNGSFNVKVCWKSLIGIQREILKITKNVPIAEVP